MKLFSKGFMALIGAFLCSVGWAAGEVISFNANNDTSNDELSGITDENTTQLRVANKYWNLISVTGQGPTQQNFSYSSVKDNADDIVALMSITGTCYGSWSHDITAAFGAKCNQYADGPWVVKVTNVPYETYDLVLYMATDNGSTWGAIGIGDAAETETFTYYIPDTTDDSTAVSTNVTDTSTWGTTTPSTHGYGIDVIRIRGLTNQTLSFKTTKANDNVRAGLHGFQIVNTGEKLRENNYVRTVTANGDWSTDGAWAFGDTTAAVPVDLAKVIADADATLTMNANADLSLFTVVSSDKTLTIAGEDDENTLTADVTYIKGNLTITDANVDLGAVTIAADKTLTVNATTAFTIANNANSGTLKVVGGTQDAPVVVAAGADTNRGGTIGHVKVPAGSYVRLHSPGDNKNYNVTGEGPTSHVYLTAPEDWGAEAVSTFDNITLEIPGTFVNETTTNPDFWLTGGMTSSTVHFITAKQVTMENSNASVFYDFASLAGSGNMNGADTQRPIKIHDGANADYSGNFSGGGNFTKVGTGTQILSGANTYTGGTYIEEGTIKITGDGVPGSGAVYVKNGATFEIEVAQDATKTLSNAIQGLTADETTTYGTIKKTGAGTLTLTAANLENFAGAITVEAGSISLPLSYAKTATMSSGTTLNVVLTDAEQLLDQTVTPADGVTVVFKDAAGNTLTSADGSYTAPVNTWTISAAGSVNWSTATWSTGSTPADTDAACIDVGANDVTVTMDAADTVKSLLVKGTGTLTIVPNNDLTVSKLVNIVSGAKLIYSVPENVTAALPRMAGEGTFQKTGTGAVRFNTNDHDNDIVAEGITIELDAGAYYVGMNDSSAGGDPYMKDVTIKFLNSGVSFGSFGWLHLEGTVTIDVPETVTDAALGGLPGKLVPSMQGANATLVKTGAGQLTACLDNIGTTSIEAGTIGLKGEKTVPGVITGAGAVTVVGTDVVTLSAANTYTGGTVIPANTTLKIVNPKALGSGTIAGAGTLEVSGEYSGNNNVDPIENRSGLTNASGWTGTVRYTTTGHQARFDADLVANENSIIEFNGAKGFFWKNNFAACQVPCAVRLVGDGLQMSNGSSGSGSVMPVVIPKLIGDGTLMAPTGSQNWNYAVMIKDASEFAGAINLNTEKPTQFSVIVGADAKPSDCGDSSTNPYVKKVTILEGATATVAAEKTWTVPDGGAVVVKGDLNILGTISGHTEEVTKVLTGDGHLILQTPKGLDFLADTWTGKTTFATTANPASTLTLTVKSGTTLEINDTRELNADPENQALAEDSTITVEEGGTLELKNGLTYINIAGAGNVVVTGEYLFGVGTVDNTLTAPVVINKDATLGIRAWNGSNTKNVNGIPSLTVNGTLKADGGDNGAASLTIADGNTLKGTGVINLATTFEAGATLDASSAVGVATKLTINGAVTLPETGTVSVTLPTIPEGRKDSIQLLAASGLDVKKFSATCPADWKLEKVDDSLFLSPRIYVAQVGDTKYEDLAEAIKDAKANGTNTVTVIGQVDWPETIPTDVTFIKGEGAAGDLPNGYMWTEGKLAKVVAVTEADGEEYATLQAAVAVGGEVMLVADVADGAITVTDGQNVTLDLNGHTVTVANTDAGNITVEAGATLNIKDSAGEGKIVTNTPYSTNTTATYGLIEVFGTFNMESGTIDATCSEPATNGQYAIVVKDSGKVDVSGGTIKAGWFALSANNLKTTANAVINITGGTFESTADYAIYLPHEGSTTIEGAAVKGAAGAIAQKAGKLTILGGTFTSTGSGNTGTSGDGTGTLANAVLNIDARYANTETTIDRGTFTAEGNAIELIAGTDTTYTITKDVAVDIDAPEGYKWDDDGKLVVDTPAEPTYVAQVGETKYETLAAAIEAAASEGGTVTIIGAVTVTAANIATGVTFINNVGDAVTIPEDYTWNSYGKLVVKVKDTTVTVPKADDATGEQLPEDGKDVTSSVVVPTVDAGGEPTTETKPSVTLPAAVVDALQAAAADEGVSGITSIAVAPVEAGAPLSGTFGVEENKKADAAVAAAVAAAELFDGVVSVENTGNQQGTAKISYAFGIADVKVRDDQDGKKKVYVAVEVRGPKGSKASFKDNTQIVLTDKNNMGATFSASGDPDEPAIAALSATEVVAVKWFETDLPDNPMDLTVKAQSGATNE